MKRLNLTIGLILTIMSLQTFAQAHPCEKIKQACEQAGFKHAEWKEKKGLMTYCFRPILNGKKIENVNVSEGEIAACKKIRSEHKKNKKTI